MLRSYVCRQCRTQLRQRIPTPRTPQWQPRATFISLRNANGNIQPEENSTVDSHNSGPPPAQISSSQIKSRPTSRYARKNGAQSAQVGADVDAEAAPSTSPAQTMNNILNDTKSIGGTIGAWNVFINEYPSRDAPAFTNPSYNDVPLLTGNKIFARLARAMVMAFCNGMDIPATPTEVLFKFEQLGIASYDIWRFAIGDMTDQLLWGICGAAARKKNPEDMIYELVSLWRLFFQCNGLEADSLESISPKWKGVPDVSAETGHFQDSRFGMRMADYHPKCSSTIPLQFSAITVFNLFDEVNQEVFKVPQALREHAAPFINFIAYLLANSNVDHVLRHVDHSYAFQSLPNDFRTSVVDQVRSAPYQAMRVTAATQRTGRKQKEAGLASKASSSTPQETTSDADVDVNTPSTDATEAKEPEPEPLSLEDMFRKRIARAVISNSHARVLTKLWEEARAVFVKVGEGRIPPLVYDAFLSGFMSLHQSEKTVEVWNHMVSSGIKPEMRTWVAMLDGCSKARDLNGLNAVWNKMIMSGAQPDDYAWTTRIHGLISLNQINLAMNAMDEMGQRYLEAMNPTNTSRKTPKGARQLPKKATAHVPVRPSTETVNAAISALTDVPSKNLAVDKKLKYIQKVLRWSNQFGIKPDAYTYNSLIKMYSRANDMETTFKLLRQMETEGIPGDTATYTMLINAAFNNRKFDNLSQSEQQDLVLTYFDELEGQGIKLNEYVYSSAIDRLLKLYGNVRAVMVLMRRMTDNRLNPSPPIYTSIVTHCFQQQPPDIASVDVIVRRIFSPPRVRTDKYLFDRIVEGYAANGQIESMMKVLTKMNSHGKQPAFSSLIAVLEALAKAGDWQQARKIVRDVQRGEGVAEGGTTGGKEGAMRFMNVARDFGIGLDEPFAGEALQKMPVQENSRGPRRDEDHNQESVKTEQS